MKKMLLVTVIGAMLSACGGSGSDSSDGTGQSKSLNGNIDHISYSDQEFTINGETVDFSQAEVTYEDSYFNSNDLVAGMRVDVDYDDGHVSEVEVEPVLTGNVDTISGNTITVNGVSFTVANPPSINTNDWVMVFGYTLANGQWQIDTVTPINAYPFDEVEGRITDFNGQAQTFKVNGMVVNYSNTPQHEIDDDQPLQNGLWVEVFGDYSSSEMLAREIDIEDEHDFDGTEVEGMISWVNSDQSQFEINGRTSVRVDSRTRFEDGNQSHITVGRLVETELKNEAGYLVAVEVEFEGNDSGVDVDSFSVEGEAAYDGKTLTINGISFITDSATYFDDGLTLATIDGRWVELEGTEVAAGFLVREVEAEVQELEISLEGPVASNTLWGYTAADNTLAQFDNTWVDVECQLNGNNVTHCQLDD